MNMDAKIINEVIRNKGESNVHSHNLFPLPFDDLADSWPRTALPQGKNRT